jgi:hypothetical protein
MYKNVEKIPKSEMQQITLEDLEIIVKDGKTLDASYQITAQPKLPPIALHLKLSTFPSPLKTSINSLKSRANRSTPTLSTVNGSEGVWLSPWPRRSGAMTR